MKMSFNMNRSSDIFRFIEKFQFKSEVFRFRLTLPQLFDTLIPAGKSEVFRFNLSKRKEDRK